jgi:hypothetical protein
MLAGMRMRPVHTLDPGIASTCGRLLDEVDQLATEVAAAIRADEPYYAENLALGDLLEANRANLAALLGQLSGRLAPDLAAPRATGRRRAEQGVPLPVVLHAYRIGGMFVWDRLVDSSTKDEATSRQLLAFASELWAVVDEYSEALAGEYRDIEADRVRAEADLRETALAALLSGDLGDGAAVLDCAESLGLPRHGSFVVVATRPTATNESTPSALERALAGAGVRSVWRARRDGHVGIVALTPRFKVERLASLLETVGSSGVGVSEVYTALSRTHAALRQARLAASATTSGNREVVRYDCSPVAVLVASEHEVSDDLMQALLGRLLALPSRERDQLLLTLRTWFDNGGSSSETARELGCHRNTVRYRLGKVADLTGKSLLHPISVAELYLALEAHRVGQ